MLHPMKPELPMLEDINYNEAAAQLYFLSKMPPRVLHGGSSYKAAAGGGSCLSRVCEARATSRGTARLSLVDEEDVSFGAMHEEGIGPSAGMKEISSPSATEETEGDDGGYSEEEDVEVVGSGDDVEALEDLVVEDLEGDGVGGDIGEASGGVFKGVEDDVKEDSARADPRRCGGGES